jgi:hypothetical protein
MFYEIGSIANSVRRSDGAFIPFDVGNLDCLAFLSAWKAGATVSNPDGSPASYNEATVESLGLTPPS